MITTDPRNGVDALTYGLATLCMGDFPRDPAVEQSFTCTNCGTHNIGHCNHESTLTRRNGQKRLGNHYPQFTRKFSLGNGPPDWVQEYLITKESGKMLGTLVALAIQRMINLETFVWDMPTGVLGDVWKALASLQNRYPSHEGRLERVWVRWHDNSDALRTHAQSSSTPSNGQSSIGWIIPAGSVPSTNNPPPSFPYSRSRVVYPTLSILPPLRCLSVLDIDELDYLDEMSQLIAKSKDRLRELRVGIAEKACKRDFAMAWDGPDLHQVDHNATWPGASTIGDKRLGGVLGVLTGRIFDIRKKQKVKVEKEDRSAPVAHPSPSHPEPQLPESHITAPMDIQSGGSLQEYISDSANVTTEGAKQETASNDGIILNPGVTFSLEDDPILQSPDTFDLNAQLPPVVHWQAPHDASTTVQEYTPEHESPASDTEMISNNAKFELPVELPLRRIQTQGPKTPHCPETASSERPRLEGKLRLQTLELERVPLSVAVLQKAFDWSVLTNLTILDCAQHEKLWQSLRRHFQPSALNGSGKHTSVPMQYHLNLKKIHTDGASKALIDFLRETLAPNTLETLFLLDRKGSAGSTVTIVCH